MMRPKFVLRSDIVQEACLLQKFMNIECIECGNVLVFGA